MAHHQRGARIIAHHFFQEIQRFQIQIVGGFVQHQEVGRNGEEPGQQVEEDLRRFKQLMETGEIASTDVQPSGRAAARGSSK